MIRIENPGDLGRALGNVRKMLGITRIGLAREIAEVDGRSIHGVENQLKSWDSGVNSPTAKALGPVLNALGWELALVPKPDVEDGSAA